MTNIELCLRDKAQNDRVQLWLIGNNCNEEAERLLSIHPTWYLSTAFNEDSPKYTVTAHAEVSDCCCGLAEIIGVDENSVHLWWISATTCYDCQRLDDDFYEKVISYPKELVTLTQIMLKENKHVQNIREQNIEYDSSNFNTYKIEYK